QGFLFSAAYQNFRWWSPFAEFSYVVCALILIAFLYVSFAESVFDYIRAYVPSDIVTFLIFTILVALVMGSSSYYIVLRFLEFLVEVQSSSKILPGAIVLPTYPLHLGETTQVQYRRQLKACSTAVPGTLSAKWVCYEWTRDGDATSPSTSSHIVFEQDLPSITIPAGTQTIEYNWRISVPTQGPPSFEAEDNQLRWELLINVDLPRIAKDTCNFRLMILPIKAK
ncbi:MAG: hypothetical protein AAF889_02810, partial [Cyanobacteria bacterium P01_D01_bin.73]